ncbi:MAG: hypothetical protein JWQ11_3100 [Rhizobacter sp.]|nr:hypothetical protein [Rhizobacter sp.]
MNTDETRYTPVSIDDSIDPVAVVALMQETLEVNRTQQETGALRVRVLVDQSMAQAANDTAIDAVTSTRVPRGLYVEARREPWNDGDVLVVPIYEEVMVCERRLMLKEEVHITRHTTRTSEPLEVPLRRERAVIERRRPDGVWISDES